MEHIFEYQQIGDKHYPIIPFLIGFKNSWVPVSALLDSGATISIFNTGIARVLKIKIQDGELFKPVGISGSIKAYIHGVKIRINDEEIDANVAFSDELAVPINLLGRESIFENFSVLFNDKEKKVVLKKL